ncbi:sulfatase [Halobellus ruber]|uniref:Sulfatase n=1 Tax=Halobellus ruber TaxID=2761102 RepID=A0A7J9SCT7_9EURY|nr:sulfatase [Halobellus ruber]MBB6644720.1 sulfatase [Halobellus ruber]
MKSIIWITIDSLRADHTSVHGYDRDTTPNLARIGEEGAVFEECIAHSVATAASTASIVTGTYPSRHQVAMGEAVGEIPEELSTAAELFSAAGYHTGCVTTNPRVSLVGADAGFDEFYDVSRSTLLQLSNLTTTVRFLTNLRSHSVGATTDSLAHSFSLILNDLARQWVESVPDDEPFFLYLHYNEPHRPYYPPLAWQDRFVDEIDASTTEAVEIAIDLHENATQYIADGLPLSDYEWEAVKAMYDAEIAYTDEMIGRLLEMIPSTADESAVVVTADHGELLGEQGLYGHLHTVIDPLIHIPAVASGIPGVSGRQSDIVQHADLMKTLLSAAGAETDQFDAAVNVASETREFAVSQERVVDYKAYTDRNPSFEVTGRPIGAINGLRTQNFKLVSHGSGSTLYRLPDEKHDISDEEHEQVERLRDALSEWRTRAGKPLTEPATEDDYDEATLERLADLGYRE